MPFGWPLIVCLVAQTPAVLAGPRTSPAIAHTPVRLLLCILSWPFPVHGPGLLTVQPADAGNKLFQTEFIQILTPGVSVFATTDALYQHK